MTRAERLLKMLALLRRRRTPVTAGALAQESGISVRTVYRDIQALVAQGARIEGEAGVGYTLRPGYLLPPLMFTPDEIELVRLGLSWAASRVGPPLAPVAADALAKIDEVVPQALREATRTASLMVGKRWILTPMDSRLAELREAILACWKVELSYRDGQGRASRRIIWPVGIGFFDSHELLSAWCETRSAFRHFRLERIEKLRRLDERHPYTREELFSRWRQETGIDVSGSLPG
jgi:predicted DNA-binding transcriptional regulator YafY